MPVLLTSQAHSCILSLKARLCLIANNERVAARTGPSIQSPGDAHDTVEDRFRPPK
ncbi:hypothetical protein MY1884_008968 [Beauveria asiatica]